MSLADRLGQRRGGNVMQPTPATPQAPAPGVPSQAPPAHQQPPPQVQAPAVQEPQRALNREVASLVAKLHSKILDRLDLSQVASMGAGELRHRLRTVVEQLVAADRMAVSEAEREAVVTSVIDELVGLGPLEPILQDPNVSDILVNGSDTIFVEKGGKLTQLDLSFRDDSHLLHTIQRIVARVGRRIDESSPMVDARLPDGSRVNAIIPPLAIDGPSLSIRRFGARPIQAADLLKHGALTEQMMDYLATAVSTRANVLITGGTGAGKTTLLNVLSSFIPADERILTIEDSAELKLNQPHVVRLESRPANLEGKGQVTDPRSGSECTAHEARPNSCR